MAIYGILFVGIQLQSISIVSFLLLFFCFGVGGFGCLVFLAYLIFLNEVVDSMMGVTVDSCLHLEL